MSEGRSASQANGGPRAQAPQSLRLIASLRQFVADAVALAHHLERSPSEPSSVADLASAAQSPGLQARLHETLAALAEARQAHTSYFAETRRALSEQRAQADLKRKQNAQEPSKAERRASLEQKDIRLAPGMNLTAEIKTGQRRVIDYLLSPIQKAGSESLRER
ncbi:hypothetical protein [Paracidovorax oryzae]|uniref:hypothetical protein n=1 Tax=Paracidovorax oryzae TaxID=862720 RepID=UPI0025A3D8CC|nr:hypothetical protein [Paracidovorax oryzae]